MLLWLRPFRLGDYIEVSTASGVVGIVEETGLFNCILKTYDGARVFAPNSTVWNFALKNHSHAPRRLLAVSVTLAGDGKGSAVPAMMAALAADSRVMKSPAPEVFLEAMTNTNVVLTCRFWSGPSAYGALQRAVVDLLRARLIDAGIKLDDIQAITRVTPPASDVTRLIDV
jgi:small conductance mechanosensitive channel